MSERIQSELETKMFYNIFVEEEELNTIRYALFEDKTYYPKPVVKGYTATLRFEVSKHSTPIQLDIPDIEYLEEFIEFLTQLKGEWLEANKKLEKKEYLEERNK